MRFSTNLRAGSVRWAAPFVLLLTGFYYVVGEGVPLPAFHGYAPALIAAPLVSLYALAYAVAAALAAWEAGRLSSSRIWELAPARSRFRVAANVLLPVVLLAWLVLLFPIVVTLARTSTFPTIGSLYLPTMALVLCMVHAVIGFGIGLRISRVIATPVMAVAVWILVAFSRATQPYWLRHVSGQYAGLSFGEVPSLASLVAPILFAGGIAAGFALLWLPLRALSVRGTIALFVAGLGTFTAYSITHDWPHNPPVITGQAPMACRGSAPKVCMPQATARYLPAVQADVTVVLDALRSHGVKEVPSVITDRLMDGRTDRASTRDTWRMSLTAGAQHDDVRFQVVSAAVRFPCSRVDAAAGHAALLWAASVTGERKAYDERVGQEMDTTEAERVEEQARTAVQKVLKQPVPNQAAWFQQTLTRACKQAGS